MIITELKPFQNETVKLMNLRESKYQNGMLFSSPGLGKSICILSVIVNNPIKTLIICPAGVVDNWMNEIKKHTNILDNCVKYYGSKRKESIEVDKLIYVTSYSLISNEINEKDHVFFKDSLFSKVKFERIVLDEAHYIRNLKSVYSNLSNSILSSITFKWIVTATPIFNSQKDCYAYFRFLQLEGIDDRKEWTKHISKNIHGLKKLNGWISKHAITFKKEDVLKELLPKKEHDIILKFNDNELEFYEALKKYSLTRMRKLLKKIKHAKKIKDDTFKMLLQAHIVVFILRLRQACNSPTLIINNMSRLSGSVSNIQEATNSLQFYTEQVNTVDECPVCYDKTSNVIIDPCSHKICSSCWDQMQNRDIWVCPHCREDINDVEYINDSQYIKTKEKIQETEYSSKIKYTIDLIKQVIQKNEKIVIVSQWVTMLDLLKNTLNTIGNIKSITLQGDIPMKARTQSIKKFEIDKNVKVCFISLMSSAEGINLVSANHIVLMDFWWNTAKITQVTDRIHRIGQTKQVNVYNLQIKNSIEDQIKKLLIKKEKMTTLALNKWNINVNNNDASWLTSIIQLVSKPVEEEIV